MNRMLAPVGASRAGARLAAAPNKSQLRQYVEAPYGDGEEIKPNNSEGCPMSYMRVTGKGVFRPNDKN